MEVQILPFKAEHIGQMEAREEHPWIEAIVSSPEYHHLVEQLGPGYTMWVDGEIIGCLVFARLMYQGVAEVLIRMSKNVEHHKLSMHRMAKKNCDKAQEIHGLHRLEARIAEDATRNRRWAESIGFKQEGVLEAFGPNGMNYIQYARVRKDLIPCRS